ncbi:hypothetical protein NQ317_009700 [Molorchus minor]|uniref:Uncharacterized protein n=1 Tax=Molorchus minor TaxID=1323400 RepID=A0ABQ9JFT7_9CUCU|nr:hypothetical protein NQ317_009700 [Molorchus minor]
MQDNNRNGERPKIAPKPVIATKPKYVPPVKIQQRLIRDDNVNIPRRSNASEYTPSSKEVPITRDTRNISQCERKFDYREMYTTDKDNYLSENQKLVVKTNIKYDEYSSTYISEKCDKFSSNNENGKKFDDIPQKAPQSPSTVCCSILSNATQDCCGIINVNKKDLNSKSMTKIDSVDSNSSDSGGFKDFVQLDLSKKLSPDNDKKSGPHQLHQRKISQPDYLDKNITENRPTGHQRKSSQPDYMSPEVRQSFAQNKQNFVANAQALASFLPQTEQKSCNISSPWSELK